jgi:hypothetical protein
MRKNPVRGECVEGRSALTFRQNTDDFFGLTQNDRHARFLAAKGGNRARPPERAPP